jgi:alpha-1,2-mannosyltransferase
MRSALVRRPIVQRLTLAVLIGLAINQFRVALESWGIVLWRPGYADFGNYYLYANVGLHHGWNHLYDLAAQRQEWLRLGGADVIPWFPIIYPPPLAWLAVPFTVLPLPVAYAFWTALLTGCVIVAWKLVVPTRSRLTRWMALAAMLAVMPVLYALLLGQILILELALIAAVWWAVSRGREAPAGILLMVLALKPQVAFLVPIALLVIGRWRTVAVWLAGSVLIAVVALLTTGIAGLRDYANRVSDAASTPPQFFVPTQFTLAGLFGHGGLTLAVAGLLVALTIAAVYRHRREGAALPIACALVGSMLVTPYLHQQDLATLLLAGAIALQGRLDQWQVRVLIAGYALILAISYWGFGSLGPILGALLLFSEAIFLLSACLPPRSGGVALKMPALGEVPLDRTA